MAARPGSDFSVPIRPHLVQKVTPSRFQVDDLYLKRLEATWAKNNRLSTTSRLLTWHSVVSVAAPQQGVAGHLPCQKCLRPAFSPVCRPGSQSANNKIIYQV